MTHPDGNNNIRGIGHKISVPIVIGCTCFCCYGPAYPQFARCAAPHNIFEYVCHQESGLLRKNRFGFTVVFINNAAVAVFDTFYCM